MPSTPTSRALDVDGVVRGHTQEHRGVTRLRRAQLLNEGAEVGADVLVVDDEGVEAALRQQLGGFAPARKIQQPVAHSPLTFPQNHNTMSSTGFMVKQLRGASSSICHAPSRFRTTFIDDWSS